MPLSSSIRVRSQFNEQYIPCTAIRKQCPQSPHAVLHPFLVDSSFSTLLEKNIQIKIVNVITLRTKATVFTYLNFSLCNGRYFDLSSS